MRKAILPIILLAANLVVLIAIFCVEKRTVFVPCKHEIIECKPEHGDAIKRMVILKHKIDEIEALRKLYTGVSDKLTKEYDQLESDAGWFEAVELCSRGDVEMCEFITTERERKLEKAKKI